MQSTRALDQEGEEMVAVAEARALLDCDTHEADKVAARLQRSVPAELSKVLKSVHEWVSSCAYACARMHAKYA